MKLIYLGAAVPSNRELLAAAGVQHVGVSFWRLLKRGLPKRKDYLLSNYFPDNMEIYVDAGVPQGLSIAQAQLEEFLAEYELFIANNLHRIVSFSELDHPNFPYEAVVHQRKTCWNELPETKFWPIWHSRHGRKELERLVDSYLDISITGEDIENEPQMAATTQTLHNRNGTRFHALGCAKPDNLRQVKLESASTMAWLAPMMRGETIIWDGTSLHRYPKRMKEQARTRYRAVYERAGLDFDKIMADDLQEVTKLALWSYESYINNVGGMANNDALIPDSNDELLPIDNAETTLDNAGSKGIQARKVEPRNPQEMGNLPVFGYEYKTIIETDEDGKDVIKEVPIVKSNTGSLRMCDTCFVASNCPAFKPQNTCAFNLPVEVKTKEQLAALINAIIEMQGQRVAFARFSEEINGGYPDPNVSQEIDRLFKLIKTVKELDDSREFVRMTVERQGTSGVLSALFGERAQVLQELPNGGLDENTTNKIIKGALEE